MTNEHIQFYKYYDKGIIQLLLPLIVFGLSFYTLPWFVNLTLFICILFWVHKNYLLAAYAFLTFYNVMLLKDAPFWASLLSSFVAIGIIILRIGTFKKRVSAGIFLILLLIIVILLNFFLKSTGEYFWLTGVKSSLQLIFLLISILSLLIIPIRYIESSKNIFDNQLLPFIVSYCIIALLFYDFTDRFGAGTGAQCLALQLSLLMCYVSADKAPRRSFQFFLLLMVFITGSRTYFLLSCFILAYDYLRKSPFRTKLIIIINVAVLTLQIVLLLPYTSTRFDFTSEIFIGSFLGRFKNYQQGFELIKQHPLTGNGMGSMLKVLENWVYKEGFQHYKEKGDTTIVHNEYLRLLIELGLLGFSLIAYGIAVLTKRLRTIEAQYVLFLFLMASVLENTLTLYTTGTLLFILVLAFAKIPKESYPVLKSDRITV